MSENNEPSHIAEWIDEVVPIIRKEVEVFCRTRGRKCPHWMADIVQETIIELLKSGFEFGRYGWKSFVKTITRRVAGHHLEKERLVQGLAGAILTVPAKQLNNPLPPLDWPPPNKITLDDKEWAYTYWQLVQDHKERQLASWQERLHREHPMEPDTHRQKIAGLLAAKSLYLISKEETQWVVYKHFMEEKGFGAIAKELRISIASAYQRESRYIRPLREALGV